MFHKNTSNIDNNQYYPRIIGDILLHSEIKSTPILVIIPSLITTSTQINKKPIIPHLLINSTVLTNNQTRILCDLTNPPMVKSTHERILSAKKFMRIQQASWALVKELKSKVIKINHIESKIAAAVNKNTNNEQAHF